MPEESLVVLRRTGLDPVPELGEIREREPISRIAMPFGLRGWLVTGDPEVREVLAASSDDFSSDFGTVIGAAGMASPDDPTAGALGDPPNHTRMRRLLAPHFTKRAVDRLSPQVEQIIDNALTDLDTAGRVGEPVDLHEFFSQRVPSDVVMDLLGVPEAYHHVFHELATSRFDISDGTRASVGAIQDSVQLFQEIVVAQRRDPGPGLIGSILRDHPDEISDFELAALVDGVVTGGIETTASTLTLGTLVLLSRPDLQRALRDDPAGIDEFVEEVLRYLTVVQVGFPRFVKRDLEIGGHQFFTGDIVVCSLSAANRDPRLGERLDEFTVDRPVPSHVAFGYGMHRCVGAELARLELRLAYPALLSRFPDLRLAVEDDMIPYRPKSIVFGVDALPVLVA